MPPDRAGRPPTATYRLQMAGGPGFRQAAGLLDHIAGLGASHLYLSPIFQARRGSDHGYDVVLPDHLDPALGSMDDFEALARRARSLGLGIVLDIVPNHLAAHEENPWWRDVLEHGRASPFAAVFDIDWREPVQQPGEAPRLVLPLLAAPYGREITRGVLGPELRDGALAAAYRGRSFPLRLGSWAPFLRSVGEEAARRRRGGADGPELLEALASGLEDALSRDGSGESSPAREEAARTAFRESLAGLPGGAGRLASLLMPARRGGAAVPEAVDRLLRRQHYRLVWWRAGVAMVNYRRFFDINDLVGVRVGDPRVFARTHALVLDLCRRGLVNGLRIDHVDGLADPGAYLSRLQEALSAPPGEEGGGGAGPPWIVVEKILAPGEELPSGWPVAGTTGYEFTAALTNLQIDPEGLRELGRFYMEFSDDPLAPGERIYLAKRRVIHDLFQSEFIRLSRRLTALASDDYRSCDLLPVEHRRALVELTAALPVYRTYLGGGEEPGARDRKILREALAAARRRVPSVDGEAFGLLQRVLLEGRVGSGEGLREQRDELIRRWQQVTGAVMAKAVEDTVLYQFPRLLSMNEVGCEPDPPPEALGTGPFHRHNRRAAAARPESMTTTSTHDSKRGEDLRARLHVLSEMAPAWEETVRRWHVMNQPWRTEIGGADLPDGREETLIYQTLAGALPMAGRVNAELRHRIRDYVIKAAREAKLRTSWLSPNAEHEAALTRFVASILDPRKGREFLRDLRQLVGRIAPAGALNALAATTLKIASPGVPDIYQGAEGWCLTLVDPDNRRPVDFAGLQAALAAAEAIRDPLKRARRLVESWKGGAIKLFVTARGLRARRGQPDLYRAGAYLPLKADGPRAGNLCAFARRHRGRWLACVVPLRSLGLHREGRPAFAARSWHRTAVGLPRGAPRTWRNLFTDEAVQADPRRGIRAADILSHFPVAILEGPAG